MGKGERERIKSNYIETQTTHILRCKQGGLSLIRVNTQKQTMKSLQSHKQHSQTANSMLGHTASIWNLAGGGGSQDRV